MNNNQIAAALILDVITSKITVHDALNNFPKDDNDVNLKCAFDALMHYEADEDIRKKSSQYAETQDEYLEFIAKILNSGKKLPKDIVARYYKYHQDNMNIGNEKGFRGFINYIKRMINF